MIFGAYCYIFNNRNIINEAMKQTLIIISIDPGKYKMGIAVFSKYEGMLYKKICLKQELNETISYIMAKYKIDFIVLGDGTGSKEVKEYLKMNFPEIKIEVVDEENTSLIARRRYLTEHPLKGIAKFIPISLRDPMEPYDDYVAVILAEKYFNV